MTKKSVSVTIDENGNPSIEVTGVVGKACTELTKALEALLGVEANRTLKPEHAKTGAGATRRVEQR